MEGQGSGAVQAKIASIGDRAADLEAELGNGLGPKLQTWPTAVAAFSQLSRQLAQLQNSSDKMFERVAVAPHAVLPDLQAIPLLLTTRLDKEHEDARDALSDAAARAVADGEVAGGAAMDGEVAQRNEALASALTHYDQAKLAMAGRVHARVAAAAAAPAPPAAPAPASAGAADHIPGLLAMLQPWAPPPAAVSAAAVAPPGARAAAKAPAAAAAAAPARTILPPAPARKPKQPAPAAAAAAAAAAAPAQQQAPPVPPPALDVDSLKVADLKKELEARGIAPAKLKAQMQVQLKAAIEAAPAAEAEVAAPAPEPMEEEVKKSPLPAAARPKRGGKRGAAAEDEKAAEPVAPASKRTRKTRSAA